MVFNLRAQKKVAATPTGPGLAFERKPMSYDPYNRRRRSNDEPEGQRRDQVLQTDPQGTAGSGMLEDKDTLVGFEDVEENLFDFVNDKRESVQPPNNQSFPHPGQQGAFFPDDQDSPIGSAQEQMRDDRFDNKPNRLPNGGISRPVFNTRVKERRLSTVDPMNWVWKFQQKEV